MEDALKKYQIVKLKNLVYVIHVMMDINYFPLIIVQKIQKINMIKLISKDQKKDIYKYKQLIV